MVHYNKRRSGCGCGHNKCCMKVKIIKVPKIIEKVVEVPPSVDPCLQLEKAIAEQKMVIESLDNQILLFGDKIKECTDSLDQDGTPDLDDQSVLSVINAYNTHMENLIHSRNNASAALQAMLSSYALCGGTT